MRQSSLIWNGHPLSLLIIVGTPLVAHRIFYLLIRKSTDIIMVQLLPPLLLIGLSLALWRFLPPLYKQKQSRPTHLGFSLAVGLLLGSMVGAINFLLMLSSDHGAIGSISPAASAAVLQITLLAPIAEELAFRGLVYRGLRLLGHRFFAALISSFVFASMHMDFTQAIWALTLGFLLCFAYEESASIITPIIIHILSNSVPVAMHFKALYPVDISPIWLGLMIGGLAFAFAASSAQRYSEQYLYYDE